MGVCPIGQKTQKGRNEREGQGDDASGAAVYAGEARVRRFSLQDRRLDFNFPVYAFYAPCPIIQRDETGKQPS